VDVREFAALPVIKQIITMFFSVNGAQFQTAQPDLARFVLDRDRRGLDKKVRLFCYFLVAGKARSIGVCAAIDMNTKRTTVMSEISFPPFGYLMTLDSEPPDDRLFEITHFSEYGYNERPSLTLRIPHVPTHTALPGDYRTLEQIYRDRDANLRAATEQQ